MTDTPTKITVRPNGSFKVEGSFQILDADGKEFDLAGRTSITLCRCGHTKEQPFCDGSHNSCGFSCEVKAYALPPKGA